MRVRIAIHHCPIPPMHGEREDRPAGGRTCVEEMAREPLAELFRRIYRTLPGQGVHGVLHRVGGKDLRVVTRRVGQAELSLQLYFDRQVV